jgi:hypothetical protein
MKNKPIKAKMPALPELSHEQWVNLMIFLICISSAVFSFLFIIG